jgi:hypothetical protein
LSGEDWWAQVTDDVFIERVRDTREAMFSQLESEAGDYRSVPGGFQDEPAVDVIVLARLVDFDGTTVDDTCTFSGGGPNCIELLNPEADGVRRFRLVAPWMCADYPARDDGFSVLLIAARYERESV